MSRGRIALVAAGLLLGIAALLLAARGLRGLAAPAAPAAPDATASTASTAAAERGRSGEKEPPPRWQSFLRPGESGAPPRPVARFAQGLSSPFDLPQKSAPRPVGRPDFQLQGISTGDRAMALVSGHAVREGESLAGYRVVRISRSGVTLAGPAGRLDLSLRAPGEGL